ncbi:MAG TPA: hypothetical protein PLH94_15195 [Fimbriimonadaceae bacterium]|nr:hypothetical protein [Fimbriimonadaceae bacterium]
MLWRKPYVTATVTGLDLGLSASRVTLILDDLRALSEALLWSRLLDAVPLDWTLVFVGDASLEDYLPPSVLGRSSIGPRPEGLPTLDGRVAVYAHSGRVLMIGPATEEALDTIIAAA